MTVPVTVIVSVVVFVPFEPGCANVSSATSVQAIVTIVFFIITPPMFKRHKVQNFVQ
jgi:hypothetical protein